MQDLQLSADIREQIGKKARVVRENGLTPGVVYGHGKEPVILAVDSKELERIFHQAGTNKLIELVVDKKTKKNVLFHDVQHDPLTGRVLHFDLYEVRMDEEIETEVPIHFVGEAPAVYNLGGVLLKNLDTIEIKSLPAHLPEAIEVDISILEELNQAVHVKDLKIASNVTVLTDLEEVVVKVDEPISEEELEAQLAEEAPAEIELPEAEHGGEDEAPEGDKQTEEKSES